MLLWDIGTLKWILSCKFKAREVLGMLEGRQMELQHLHFISTWSRLLCSSLNLGRTFLFQWVCRSCRLCSQLQKPSRDRCFGWYIRSYSELWKTFQNPFYLYSFQFAFFFSHANYKKCCKHFLEVRSSYLSKLCACCWCLLFFQHPHTSLCRLGSVKAIMVIRSEMIFCSHSAKEIAMDVIRLGWSPCCRYIILL